MNRGHDGSRTLADGDRHARSVILAHCPVVMENGTQWYEMEATPCNHLEEVSTAVQWIETRGAALHGYRAIRDPAQPSLIRFENVPDTWHAGYASQLHIG